MTGMNKGAARMICIKNEWLTLSLDTGDGSLTLQDRRNGLCYRTAPLAGTLSDVSRTDGGSLRFRLTIGEDSAEAALCLQEEGRLSITVTGQGTLHAPFGFPGAWRAEAGDEILYPLGEGIRLPAEELPSFPQTLYYGNGSHLSLGMWGLLRGEGGMFFAVQEMADAALVWHKDDAGLTCHAVQCLPSRGEWAYPRRFEVFVAKEDAFNRLCHTYRAWRMSQGMVVPLTKKAEHAPRILNMAGRADVWLFDDQNMNRLYGRKVEPEQTSRDVQRVVEEMKQRSMDRVLWNSFEHEAPEDVEYLKSNGFEVGHYDVYRDVIPKPLLPVMLPYRAARSRHTELCWPKDVCRARDGSYVDAWLLHGTDGQMHPQHAVCDIPALRMTMEDVPVFIDTYGYTSWFIDVASCARPQECFHPRHPMSRRDSVRYINAQNQFLLDLGLICGVEGGCETTAASFVFSEGMMSPVYYRAPDSGRNMNTLYYGDQMPTRIREYMLNPRIRVPLWEMIYHDCTISYWYWGDSSNCCPELMQLRDQFNALYAVPPLYSLNMSQWDQLKEEIAASYHRATPAARHTAFSPMVRFEYLTQDRLVQRTLFENGLEVVANFSGDTYDGIAPGECCIQTQDGSVIASF